MVDLRDDHIKRAIVRTVSGAFIQMARVPGTESGKQGIDKSDSRGRG
jgi:hypothetical protein